MRSRLNNGFVRLAMVFLVGWWLVWGTVLYRAISHVHGWEGAVKIWMLNYNRERDSGAMTETTREFTDSSLDGLSEAKQWLWFIEESAFGGFLAIPLVFASGVWIWRGFQNSN